MSFSLRPIRAEDEDLILRARNSDGVRMFMLSKEMIAPEVHAAWLAGKLAEADVAPYFLFLHEGRAIGVVGITRYDAQLRSGEWGFYIFGQDAPKGAGTVMGAIFMEVMLGREHIRRVTAVVFAHNVKSMAMHERLGFVRRAELGGQAEDMIVMSLDAEQWQRTRQRFLREIETVNVTGA